LKADFFKASTVSDGRTRLEGVEGLVAAVVLVAVVAVVAVPVAAVVSRTSIVSLGALHPATATKTIRTSMRIGHLALHFDIGRSVFIVGCFCFALSIF
jgi:hypothetical protein